MNKPTDDEIKARVKMNEERHSQYSPNPRTQWSFIAELQLQVEQLEKELRKVKNELQRGG